MRSLRLAVVVLLLVPSGATAQATNAPPGNSAIDEYLETVPSSSGNGPPSGRERDPGAGRPAPRPHAVAPDRAAAPPAPAPAPAPATLTPAQRTVLERHGSEGEALARFVESDPPRARRAPLPDPDGGSPLAKVVQTSLGESDGGGLGLVLPLILSSALLAAVAVVLVRRRSASPPHP